MMMRLCCDVLSALKGKTLVTAESCTGGGIGSALTCIAGSSEVYKGGIISYTNEVKINQLGVDPALISREGAVSASVAKAMALGARNVLKADIAVSVTGLAGPGGDDFGNSVGTVFIGYADAAKTVAKEIHFIGDREAVRRSAVEEALRLVLQNNK